MSITIGALLGDAVRQLAAAGSRSPRLDAELLLAHVLDCERLVLIRDADRPVEEARVAGFAALLARRLAREPVAYLRGKRDFYGQTFRVTPAVLIPRPETEMLVDLALAAAPGGRILDLGTGSGILAITLRRLLPACPVTAVDISAAALAVARGNAETLLGKNHGIEFLEGDLFAPLDGPFALIVSNPPYVGAEEYAGLEPNVRDYEPALALLAGQDGLAVIRRILDGAREYLAPDGVLLIEASPATAGPALAEARGFHGRILKDLAGLERVLELRPVT